MLLACVHRVIPRRTVTLVMTPEVWAGVLAVLTVVSTVCTVLVLLRTQHPASVSTRVRELELQVADIADFVERRATRERVRNMREGREKNAVPPAPEPGSAEYKTALRQLARQKGLP
jgi:hypothetical protein